MRAEVWFVCQKGEHIIKEASRGHEIFGTETGLRRREIRNSVFPKKWTGSRGVKNIVFFSTKNTHARTHPDAHGSHFQTCKAAIFLPEKILHFVCGKKEKRIDWMDATNQQLN
jgi:hypothetical protein